MDNIAKDYGERFVHRMLPGVAETLPPSNLDEIRDLEHQHYQHYPKPSQKPLFKLDQWYRSIAKTHIEHGAKPKVFSRLAAYYHDKHLIKQEEIPQSYFTRLAKDPAQELGPGWKQEQTNLVIDRQKNSLNKWLKYLTSPQTEAYPIWMKHWVFEGVLKLGALDTQSYEYERRRSTTVAPFPELNSEALANVIGLI